MAPDALDLRGARPSRREALAFASTSLWADLDPALQKRLNGLAQVRHFPKGTTIVAQEDLPPLVLWVVSGVARLVRRWPDGRELIVGLKMPSDIFGHARMRPLSFALEASTGVGLLSFDRGAFEALARDFPEFGQWLTERYLDELDATREWMCLLGCRSVKARFASFLIMLHRRRNERLAATSAVSPDPPSVDVRISHRDIALCLRTTKESISRSIRSLERDGVIHAIRPRAFVLVDYERLAAISGDEPRSPQTVIRDRAQLPRYVE